LGGGRVRVLEREEGGCAADKDQCTNGIHDDTPQSQQRRPTMRLPRRFVAREGRWVHAPNEANWPVGRACAAKRGCQYRLIIMLGEEQPVDCRCAHGRSGHSQRSPGLRFAPSGLRILTAIHFAFS
jgi:hypothetical protein